MKVTKWIDFSQEVTIEIGSDDIRVALSEAFANALPIGKGREEPSRQDILIAFNAAGAFMRAMTDEDIALMLSAQRAVIAKFLGEEARRFQEKSECTHERLNEDGICRNCGADRRGL